MATRASSDGSWLWASQVTISTEHESAWLAAVRGGNAACGAGTGDCDRWPVSTRYRVFREVGAGTEGGAPTLRAAVLDGAVYGTFSE